jgi:hypothetical protein
LNSLSIVSISQGDTYDRTIVLISNLTDLFGNAELNRKITVTGVTVAVGTIIYKAKTVTT